jgi:ankyrin repeat protein
MGHLELIKFIVANGVPIDTQNNTGKTAFHMASEKGHAEVAMWLLENGAKMWV